MRPFVVSGMIISSLVLGGCSLVAQPADVATESPATVITGVVRVSGELITIQVVPDKAVPDGVIGKTTEIKSRKIDLKQYNGKKVTVTGEFSGTTLFVDEVKSI